MYEGKDFYNPGGIIAFIISGSAAYAGGSFLIDDIKLLLPSRQRYRNTFSQHSIFPKAVREPHRQQYQPEAGRYAARTVLYICKPKGTAGKNTLEVCINTEYHFRDKTGRPCTLEQAYSVTEVLFQ